LSAFAVLEPDPVKRAKIFLMKKKYGDLAWREMEDQRPMVAGSRRVGAPRIKRAKRGGAELQRTSFFKELREACRAVCGMWIRRR
jgi:hypothetical protein